MSNIFILGLDPFNAQELQSIREAESHRFVKLLGYEQVVHPEGGQVDFDALLADAEAQLRRFAGPVDAIVSYWDFPSSALAGVLRNRLGLPGPTNEAIAKCEHKYWSRLEQRAVVPDLVPAFCAVDPFAEDPLRDIALDFPYWIKPIKAHSSHLGFKIRRPEDLRLHLPQIRAKISNFGVPCDQFLGHVELPEAVRPVNGHWCIAESIISAGQQCTLEGYVCDGEVTVYGVVDSLRSGLHRSSFSRYQYPSQLPRRVQQRMIAAAAKVMTRFGYDQAPFNMEFYWERRSDRIHLLEVNSRISKSHCPLFRLVDGASHQEVMIDLALGRRPDFAQRQGRHRLAGKFMVRVYEDGVVKRLPSQAELDRVRELFPEVRVHLLTEEGARLAHLPYQDSYSFELAEIFLGADDQPGLLEKYRRCLDILTFDVRPDRPAARKGAA